MDEIENIHDSQIPEITTPLDLSAKHVVISKQLLIGIGIVAFVVGGIVNSYFNKYEIGVRINPKTSPAAKEKITEALKEEADSEILGIKKTQSPYLNYGHFIGVRGLQNVNPAAVAPVSLDGAISVVTYSIHYQGYSQSSLSVMQSLYDSYKGRIYVVAIENSYGGYEKAGSTPEKIQATAAKLGLTFPIYSDIDNLRMKYIEGYIGIYAWPTTLILDKDQNVRWAFYGYIKPGQIDSAIEGLLSDTSALPDTIQSIVESKRGEILKANSLEKIDRIEYGYIQALDSKDPSSPTVVNFNLWETPDKIYTRNGSEHVVNKLFFTYENGQWIIGMPYDAIYCRLLKESSISENSKQLYGLSLCK